LKIKEEEEEVQADTSDSETRWRSACSIAARHSRVGGAAEIAVSDNKAAQRQLKELQHHNRAMKGRGVYLAPFKRGQDIARRKKKH